jgi:hypothetical protein
MLTALLGFRRGLQRHPELSWSCRSKLEPLRQNANNDAGSVIQNYRFSKHVLFFAEPLLPSGIGKDDSAGSAGRIFAGTEVTTEDWGDSQQAKESRTHRDAISALHPGSGLQCQCVLVEGLHGGEDMVQLFPVEIVQMREMETRSQGCTFEEAHQTGGILVRQRGDQYGIDKGKDRYAGTNTQGQHQDRGQCESRVPDQLARGVTDIRPDTSQERHKVHVDNAFFGRCPISETQ